MPAPNEFKIHAKLYCALQKRSESEGKNMLPLSYIVPDGTDAAAKKRKGNADSWAKRGYRGDSLPPMIFENKPIPGFKLLSGTRTASVLI